jgi:hypothetical protein
MCKHIKQSIHRNISFDGCVHGVQIKGGDKLFVLAVLPKGGVAAKNTE